MAKFKTDWLSGGGESQLSLLAIGWEISTGELEQCRVGEVLKGQAESLKHSKKTCASNR